MRRGEDLNWIAAVVVAVVAFDAETCWVWRATSPASAILGVWATFAVSETFAAKAEETAPDIEGSNCPLAPRVSWRIAAEAVVIPPVFVTAEEVVADGFDYSSPNSRDVAISDSVLAVAALAESVRPGGFVAYAPA